MRNIISDCAVTPASVVNRDGMQLVSVTCSAGKCFHGTLRAKDRETGEILGAGAVALSAGGNKQKTLIPAPQRDRHVIWEFVSSDGETYPAGEGEWKKPREWTLWFMVSSHTDIGLHNSQYHQRWQSEQFLDRVMTLCDETEDRPEENRYGYTIEGTWFFGNYPMDRGREAARKLVEKYIKPGRIGLCTGIAGNHTQVFGPEEMNRAAYGRRRMKEEWGIESRTLTMIDNNGLSWGMVQPFAEAGYENLIFAPNQWNPRMSSVWKADTEIEGFVHNCEAGGGGSRIDTRFASALPRLFFWQAKDGKNRLLVWSGGNYGYGGAPFGLMPFIAPGAGTLLHMEDAMAGTLPMMEEKYPYDLWLTACYQDDQEPNLSLADTLAAWNEKWLWPRLRICGSPDVPFGILRRKFGDRIPVLRGEITGGWYQHPVSAPELLARKMEAERVLTDAEKLSSVCAAMLKAPYPAQKLDRAWWGLMLNDEHSYGVSGYQGRRVYETWIQHRDWIETAEETGEEALNKALSRLADAVSAGQDSVLLVNTASVPRTGWVTGKDGRICRTALPAFGYRVQKAAEFALPAVRRETPGEPPTAENAYYRLRFDARGGIASIYDKELGRELLREGESANELKYTRDNHLSYTVPGKAAWQVTEDARGITVTARMTEGESEAGIEQRVTLPSDAKRIDIENRLTHVRGMFNTCRYDRYLYQAFPFDVEGARRYCHLNGCVAEYAKDLTGHSTDTYMNARDWCCAENGTFGVGLIGLDSALVEFDHIHPDKTDYGAPGEGSAMYVYLANDWLQMHAWGGDDINFRFRFTITSYACGGQKPGYEEADLAGMAECCRHPVLALPVPAKKGTLPEEGSFLETAAGVCLAGLKRAEDGRGLIARLYAAYGETALSDALRGGLIRTAEVTRNTPDEREAEGSESFSGYAALRLNAGDALPAESLPQEDLFAIGSGYTGLLRRLRGARGENRGHIYLLWGAVQSEDLAFYRVYRAEAPGLAGGEGTLIGEAQPEKYIVGRWVDEGLKDDAVYYYRVRAVAKDGSEGPLSEEIAVHTLQP